MNSVEIYDRYRDLLLKDIVPFWLEKGIDWKFGGVLSCMTEQGQVISGDKFIWSQARSVWTFSALYNRIEKRPEFLRAAANSVRFLMEHGRDSDGRWVFSTTREGKVLEGHTSIYADCFAVYGLNEYFRACGDVQALELARETFDRIRNDIEQPEFSATAPYPLPYGWVTHGIPMILTEVTNELAQTTQDASLEPIADSYVQQIMQHFVRSEKQALLEYMTRDFEELPSPAGSFVVPGHAIESMWFVLHLARRRNDGQLIRRAAEVIRWHLELGWDHEFGGLFLNCDIADNTPYLPHSEKKLWWPHAEALYATLLTHELTAEAWCLDWHKRVSKWAWAHFCNPIGGDWIQRLDREGKPVQETIALPVKDPFHLPRAAILIMQLLQPNSDGHEA